MAPFALFLLLASSFTSVLATSQHGMKHRQDIAISEQTHDFASTLQILDAFATRIIDAGEADPLSTASTAQTTTASLGESTSIQSVLESSTVQPPSPTVTNSAPAAPSTVVSTDTPLSSTTISTASATSASVTTAAGPPPAILSNLKKSTTSTSVSAPKTSSIALPSQIVSASASLSAAKTGAAQKRGGDFVGYVAVAVVAGVVGSLLV